MCVSLGNIHLINVFVIKFFHLNYNFILILFSASIYANISAYDIDYFTDLQGVRICEEDFVDIVTQQKTHPEFQLKIVLKTQDNSTIIIQMY